MAHDVFISHSSKDKRTADAVCAVLESDGIRCWVAPRDIIPGMDWGGSIVEAIKGARVMVLVFSGHANESPQIKLEVERAVNKGVPIIPLRIEDILPTEALELFLGSRHWLDAFTPPLENHLRTLAQIIRHFPGVTPAKGPLSPVPENEARKNAEVEATKAAAVAKTARLAEENRQAEIARLDDEKRKSEEAAKLAEQKRQAAEASARARLEAEKRKTDEIAKSVEEKKKLSARNEVDPTRATRSLVQKIKPTWRQTVWLCAMALALVCLGRLHSDINSGGSANGPLTALDWIVTPLLVMAILFSLGLFINLTHLRHWSFPRRLILYLSAALGLSVASETSWSILSAPDPNAPYEASTDHQKAALNAFYRSPFRGLDDIIDTQTRADAQYQTMTNGFSSIPTIYNMASKIFIPIEAWSYTNMSSENKRYRDSDFSTMDAYSRWAVNNPNKDYAATLKTLWIILMPLSFCLWSLVLTIIFEIYRCPIMTPLRRPA